MLNKLFIIIIAVNDKILNMIDFIGMVLSMIVKSFYYSYSHVANLEFSWHAVINNNH